MSVLDVVLGASTARGSTARMSRHRDGVGRKHGEDTSRELCLRSLSCSWGGRKDDRSGLAASDLIDKVRSPVDTCSAALLVGNLATSRE